MNINLGNPYEEIIKNLIEKGYGGDKIEIIRQALMNYKRDIDDEELFLLNKGIESEMEKIRSGKVKAKPLKEFIEKHKGNK